MSYSIDRSARTRGVNAIAATDLRGDDGGGALIRTGRGPVVIVSRGEGLGGWSAGNPYRNKLPWKIQQATQWEKDHQKKVVNADRRAGVVRPNTVKVRRSKAKSRKRTVVHLLRKQKGGGWGKDTYSSGGGQSSPDQTAPSSVIPPSSSSSPTTGGGGSGGGSSWGGGGGGGGEGRGEDKGPQESDPGSEDSVREQEAAAEAAAARDSGPGPETDAPRGGAYRDKEPMSPIVKLALLGAAGYALYTLFGKEQTR